MDFDELKNKLEQRNQPLSPSRYKDMEGDSDNPYRCSIEPGATPSKQLDPKKKAHRKSGCLLAVGALAGVGAAWWFTIGMLSSFGHIDSSHNLSSVLIGGVLLTTLTGITLMFFGVVRVIWSYF